MTGLKKNQVLAESKRNPRNTPLATAWYRDFFKGWLLPNCARCCNFYSTAEHRCTKGHTAEPSCTNDCIACVHFLRGRDEGAQPREGTAPG